MEELFTINTDLVCWLHTARRELEAVIEATKWGTGAYVTIDLDLGGTEPQLSYHVLIPRKCGKVGHEMTDIRLPRYLAKKGDRPYEKRHALMVRHFRHRFDGPEEPWPD